MADRFGSSDNSLVARMSGIVDASGNRVISSGNSFGDSPLGAAPLLQSIYTLANPTFNQTPPNVSSAISDSSNPLPYWSVDDSSAGNISATMSFSTATGTWGVKIDPTTAVSGDTFVLKTRSYIPANDDNLGLRQKLFAVLTKNGTYSSTTQWNFAASVVYYDGGGSSVGSATVGTVYDNTTWTSLSGFTTTNGTAINASAEIVDVTFTLTATADVTSGTSVTIQSALLSTKVGANSAFLVTETFTSSGTWTRPTGVNYLVGVIAVGGGGGGGGGSVRRANSTTGGAGPFGGGGGASSRWAYAQNLYVGDVSTISIGIGAGGVGGTAAVTVKASGNAGTAIEAYGGVGANGGATTFGSYLSIPGGGGGSANASTAGTGSAGGIAGATATTTIYGLALLASVGGAATLAAGTNVLTADPSGTVSTQYATPQMPVYSTFTAGGAGGTGVGTVTVAGGTVTTLNVTSGAGGAGGAAGIIASGGAGGYGGKNDSPSEIRAGGAGGNGGGGGAGGGYFYNLTSYTGSGTAIVSITGGAGGTASANSGAGGGGGGGVAWQYPSATARQDGTATAGTGGKGGDGIVVVAYIA